MLLTFSFPFSELSPMEKGRKKSQRNLSPISAAQLTSGQIFGPIKHLSSREKVELAIRQRAQLV